VADACACGNEPSGSVKCGELAGINYYVIRIHNGMAPFEIDKHPFSAVRHCLFEISAATHHTGGGSSVRNLRTQHSVLLGPTDHGPVPQIYRIRYTTVDGLLRLGRLQFWSTIMRKCCCVSCAVGLSHLNWIFQPQFVKIEKKNNLFFFVVGQT